jgi:molybdate transport system substrate-binding protein
LRQKCWFSADLRALVAICLLVACAGPQAVPTAAPTAAGATAGGTAVAAAPVQTTSTPEATVVATPQSRDPGRLVVVAASSLANPFQELASAFLSSTPAATGVSFNFASVGQLRVLIGQGIDADVLATDDRAQMDEARQAHFVEGQDQVFGHNRLVIIVPKANPKQIAALKDLAGPGVRWVTTDPAEPTEPATLALLDRAAADPDYGTDFRSKAERNIQARIGAPDEAVATVQAGQADATVVYASAVEPAARAQVQQIEVADGLRPASDYAIAVTRSANTQIAQTFIAFVLSPRGQEILKKWGIVAEPAGG